MAGAAAFFVLTALAFTFEPLVTLILKSRTLPAGTTTYLSASPAVNGKPDFFGAVMKTVPPSHGWAGNIALLTKLQEPLFGFNIASIAIFPWSLEIDTSEKPEQAMTTLRRHLSKLTPFEINTPLPDGTAMTEIVIDPQLIEVRASEDQKNRGWIFTQTSPQLFVKNNGLNSSIYLGYPQDVNAQGFESLSSCRMTTEGLRTVTVDSQRRTLISSVFHSIIAYLSDYSCFQSFSTIT